MNIRDFFRAALWLTILVIAMGAVESVLADHTRIQPKYSKPACTPFELHARGGEAGIRFMHNIGDYHRVKNRVYHGRICRDGPLTVELSKRHPDTRVILKINGARYEFRPGEKAHRTINHWHRKYVRFHLPGKSLVNHGIKQGGGLKQRHNHNGYGRMLSHSNRHRYGHAYGQGYGHGFGSRYVYRM